MGFKNKILQYMLKLEFLGYIYKSNLTMIFFFACRICELSNRLELKLISINHLLKSKNLKKIIKIKLTK